SDWTLRRAPLSRDVSPEPRKSCYRADRPFHLALWPRVPSRSSLPLPPALSLPVPPDPVSDALRAARPVVATVDAFALSHRLDYVAHFVGGLARSPITGGASVFPLEVLEDRQFELKFLAGVVPHLCAMLLAPERGLDTLDIPTPCTHAEAGAGPYAPYWIAAKEAEMASYRSTCTFVDAIPPPRANVVSGRWRYKVKWPPGSPPVFKMTTLRVLLHIAAQHDYELHSSDFSIAFLQGSLHEQIWLRRPPGFTGSFPAGTQWQLRRPVYGLRQAPCKWHNTLCMTLAAFGFFPSSAGPSLFLRRGSIPFFVLVYVSDLVFATLDSTTLSFVKEELLRRHTCTDLGELQHYLGLLIIRDMAARTITLTQSHMVEQTLTQFRFPFSSVQLTPLAVDHGLTAPPSDESFESSGPYPELVGCLIYLMTCTRPDLSFPLSVLACFVAPRRHRPSRMAVPKRVLKYVAGTSGMGLVLGGKQPVTLTGFLDSSYADYGQTYKSSQGYCFSLGTGVVSWRSTRASSVTGSSCEAEVYAAVMAAQELCWLSYLLTDLGVSQVDPPPLTAPIEVTGDSGPAEGGPARGATSGGAEPRGVEPGGAEPEGAESGGAELGGTESGGVAPGGAEASSEQSPWSGRLRSRSAGVSSLHSRCRLPLSPQQLREWYVGCQGHAAGARGPAAGGAGACDSATGVVSAGGSRAAASADARGSGAAGGAGAGGAGAGGSGAAEGASARGSGAARGAGAGGAGAGGCGAATGAGAGGSGAAAGAGAEGSESVVHGLLGVAAFVRV
ncbi:unnamed protein product, partial [Closterium sp. NIES-53]